MTARNREVTRASDSEPLRKRPQKGAPCRGIGQGVACYRTTNDTVGRGRGGGVYDNQSVVEEVGSGIRQPTPWCKAEGVPYDSQYCGAGGGEGRADKRCVRESIGWPSFFSVTQGDMHRHIPGCQCCTKEALYHLKARARAMHRPSRSLERHQFHSRKRDSRPTVPAWSHLSYTMVLFRETHRTVPPWPLYQLRTRPPSYLKVIIFTVVPALVVASWPIRHTFASKAVEHHYLESCFLEGPGGYRRSPFQPPVVSSPFVHRYVAPDTTIKFTITVVPGWI